MSPCSPSAHTFKFIPDIPPQNITQYLRSSCKLTDVFYFETILLPSPRTHSAPVSALSKSPLESSWKHNTPTGVVSPGNQVGNLCVCDCLCYVRTQNDKNKYFLSGKQGNCPPWNTVRQESSGKGILREIKVSFQRVCSESVATKLTTIHWHNTGDDMSQFEIWSVKWFNLTLSHIPWYTCSHTHNSASPRDGF